MKASARTATRWLATGLLLALPVPSQTIEFDSGGLRYQAQTRAGLTVMVAPLGARILGYAIIQVAVSNGNTEPQKFQPQSFVLQRADGSPVRALSASAVVSDVLDRASRGDVGRLVSLYEAALFGNNKLELRHGYEARRKDAMAVGGNTRVRAAATAAAIVLGSKELAPGESIDGAVFFPNTAGPLGGRQILFEAAGERFQFTLAPDPVPAR
jgi:hypothetical protein